MTVEIREELPAALADYARVSIAFEVRERVAVHALEAGSGGFRLSVEPVLSPYFKDYDAAPGHHPTTWSTHFDLSRWAIFVAWVRGERAGGAIVAWDTPGLDMLEGRADLAVLWDLRVTPMWRGRGVGGALFGAVEAWARARGARWLKVETQNINVPACRFYDRQGCTLGAIHRFAYPALPEEVQFLWYKELEAVGGGSVRTHGLGAAVSDLR